MRNIYIVIKKCGEEISTYAYASKQDAIRHIEESSNQKQDEWDFDNGTTYTGDNNYETIVWLDEDELREGAKNA